MAGGLTYRAVQLRRADRSMLLELDPGTLAGKAKQRGEDWIIESRSGRIERPRVDDVRVVELAGWIRGIGATHADRIVSYRALVDELDTIFLPTFGDLVASAPYLGIPTGQTRTLSVRWVSTAWGRLEAGYFQRLSVELESISNPPDWVVAGP